MASELLVHAIGKALDGLAERQLVTAQNIANANSPSYVPLRVVFEQQLAHAVLAAQGQPARADLLRDVQPQIIRDPLSVADEPMRLDQEIATASETAMRYSALLSVLDRLFALKNVVITGS